MINNSVDCSYDSVCMQCTPVIYFQSYSTGIYRIYVYGLSNMCYNPLCILVACTGTCWPVSTVLDVLAIQGVHFLLSLLLSTCIHCLPICDMQCWIQRLFSGLHGTPFLKGCFAYLCSYKSKLSEATDQCSSSSMYINAEIMKLTLTTAWTSQRDRFSLPACLESTSRSMLVCSAIYTRISHMYICVAQCMKTGLPCACLCSTVEHIAVLIMPAHAWRSLSSILLQD